MESFPHSRPVDVVAELEGWPSGIAVSPSGRLFVSFPRADQLADVPTLTEIRDGRVIPFPDALMNDVTSGGRTQRFTSIHGLRAGPANQLFAIDTGSKSLSGCDPSAAALWVIDLDLDVIVRRYAFPPDVVFPTTYLNEG